MRAKADSAGRTVALLKCCGQSLQEKSALGVEDGGREVCSYSYGADVHRLLRVGGEWQRVR